MAGKAVPSVAKTWANTPIVTLIDLFIVSKQIEGRSAKTLTWYRANLERFAGFMTNGHEATLSQLSLDDARAFIAHLQGRTTRYDGHQMRRVQEGGLSPHSVHAYVRTLKVFGNWLCAEGYVRSHPFERLKPPKLPETMIEILSDDEILALIGAVNPNSPLGARMHAIVLLLLDTGIRATELCNLTLDHTNLKDGSIKVRGKGNKERMVPIGGATKKSLMRYIQAFRPEPLHDGVSQVFLSDDATPLTYTGLSQALRRLGKAAGVNRLHAHLFRHTFAVRYLMNGGDIMTLRLILGHTTLEVTQMYMHLAEAHVQIQHHKFSPVDRLGIGKRRRS
jgi:integrase/recombinase XerC/integrase/recombinase XerD